MIQPALRYRFPNATDDNPTGHLSPSQISSWMNCGACYEAERVLHIPRPVNIALPIGIGVHRAVEHYRHKALNLNDGSLPGARGWAEAIDAAVQAFEEVTTVPFDADSGTELVIDLGSKTESVDAAKDEVVRLSRFILPAIADLDAQRGLIAAEYKTDELPEDVRSAAYPFPMVGRIDALYGGSDGYATMLADLKTSGKREAPSAQTAIQMSIYRRFFAVAGTDLTTLVDVVAKTKAPDFQTYAMTTTAEMDAAVHALVLDVADKISAGYFPPRPGFTCSYTHNLPAFSVAVRGFA